MMESEKIKWIKLVMKIKKMMTPKTICRLHECPINTPRGKSNPHIYEECLDTLHMY